VARQGRTRRRIDRCVPLDRPTHIPLLLSSFPLPPSSALGRRLVPLPSQLASTQPQTKGQDGSNGARSRDCNGATTPSCACATSKRWTLTLLSPPLLVACSTVPLPRPSPAHPAAPRTLVPWSPRPLHLMPLLGRRNLPPPQPRRVLPPRSLRFGSSYKAPPSSDDQWQPGQSSSSPSATGEDGSQAPDASVGAGSGGERVDSPASPSVVGPPAALDVVGIDPPRASSNRTRPVLAIAGTSRPHAESSPTPPLRPVSPSLARSPSLSSPGTTPPPGPAARRESKSLPTTRGSTDSGQGESKVSKVTVKAGSKVYQCSGYGDCSMVFTRAEHLARHIRCVCATTGRVFALIVC
jgi:hypothetical protein